MTRDDLFTEIEKLGGKEPAVTSAPGMVGLRFVANGKGRIYGIRHNSHEAAAYPAFLSWAKDDFARGFVRW
jgi:hypothetical protein